ncbi:hypothetical protein SK128_019362 [Halocaridina rubra]|uniref:Metalloendopeptidase n=1 Tax=Halocaridina rubra TaxID=373956 RepID=A0AAN8ZYP9_HALRR
MLKENMGIPMSFSLNKDSVVAQLGWCEGNDRIYVRIFYGKGCNAQVGRTVVAGSRSVPVFLSLGYGCNTVGTAIHEFGHILGLLHQQMRTDRDEYIQIMWNNVVKYLKVNFQKAFSKDGSITMRTQDPKYQGLLGRSHALSHRDKLIVNRMYRCIDYWIRECDLKYDPCLNEGYIGAECQCICPPGTQGHRCETVTGTYYSDALPKCSRIITKNGTMFGVTRDLQDDKGFLKTRTWCVYQIIAPLGYYISVEFTDFRLDEISFNGQQKCVISFLLIMMDNGPDAM